MILNIFSKFTNQITINMKTWRDKLGLRDHFALELDMTKSDFVNRLQKIVDHGSTGMFSNSFEALSSSKNIYKGEVSSSGFNIRRRRRLFEFNQGAAIAVGSISQSNEKVVIDTEINGFQKKHIFFFVILILLYTIFMGLILFLPSDGDENFPIFILPFILLHGAFMIFLPYMMMKKSVARTKYDLEREFFF